MSNDNTPAQTLELVTFQLRSGIAADAFLKASRTAEEFIKKQPGFLYRSLCQQQDTGDWLDVLYWQDNGAAEAAGKAVCSAEETAEFMSMIDPQSVTMRHAQIRSSLCMVEQAA